MRLVDLLPSGTTTDEDVVYDAISRWVEARGLTLYPAQDEAILECVAGSNVVLATPTGSGKSLVATGAMAAALARGECSVYTAPIKALVSEKFFDLCEIFGAENVGMVTGDAAVNADAPIIAATAEILANMALREGADADIGLVVMDEFHFYADPDRGWAWQVPLIELPRAQFLLMSATLGDTTRLEADLARRTGRETTVVSSVERPVPLVTEYVTTPVQETLEELIATGQTPVYVVHFTQVSALERAQALTSIKVATREERDLIAEALGDFRFSSAFGKTLSRLIRMGVGVHHAGMLPRYRRLVETLTQAGLLKVVCGTDTLGVGINVPIRTVLFSGLSKYDGTRQRQLQVREFQQIAGRAGRAGYDTIGHVVVEAPEHDIENARLLRKAGDDVKKQRRIQRKKPPEGFVSWGQGTFEKLSTGTPEPLVSRMRVSHAMVLDVISRPGDARASLERLLRESGEPAESQDRMLAEVDQIIEALLTGGVVEAIDPPDSEGRTLQLTIDLQANFALNQPLSPFAVAALDLLDREAPTYALDVVSVIEATLDDPRPIINAQRHRARGEAIGEMKMDGIEYDERMELLEEVTHPKPLEELLTAGYEAYRIGHPWVADHELRPKSVVREMWERAMTFSELIGDYQLARSEGLVLRYLSDVYKTLGRTVPEKARNGELEDLTEWLGELVRQTDSSLLDEWEELIRPGTDPADVRPRAESGAAPRPVTGNPRAFRVLVRNALFRRVELAAFGRWTQLGELDAEDGWDATAWMEAMTAYREEYADLGTGPGSRGPELFMVEEGADTWTVRQTFDDPEGDRDWGISAEVDLAASDEAGEAVVRILDVGPR
ncbi:DEAD/DEAH box helicase [Aeromicrobium marinum DSM 15272]|uniref:DEAD/DEAH box helicase n=1 Tax=Aeromicrobium marinum DSM 15272 TaxID=585531 RepID=E2SF50_9ACTN|nr:DEAD/DEAH box helicase [Aeromicrobium marinum]EFQ82135.1 DEAD/DEAH box helicase [Aeromicrobium marinum DSM 15272]